jgi:tagatose 1,6-diphosphate aldolase GatY/KbaY
MLSSTLDLLRTAEAGHYAVGAFNVYDLAGVKAVVQAAEAEHSSAMLALHPAPIQFGGQALVAMCLAAADEARAPMSVHLDHSARADDIRDALDRGLRSVMADGTHLNYDDNLRFSREMAALAHAHGAAIEAELGKLSGTEDGLTVAEVEAKMTDPGQAVEFVRETGIDAFAVCIGNVHGRYRGEPVLDFARLAAIRQRVAVPLVLHGASGLPGPMIRRAIDLGVRKFNVNTEVREAYLTTLKVRLSEAKPPDLMDLMQSAVAAMQAVVAEKMRMFGSSGRAD